ncbi:PREDICTED: G patch domain and ankyrin repeat-containing protein 1-like [Priapulus caudatus]|uniref:G patch domain and ankyrin repeat-containing protein 1-like n=1 Tax=Priapulus caudatus TaxID=37621 RepID=A0ABM1ETC4_PRICU|nr:PREDICTED: G patch domain and ankyrin repeat-containing protein 1-like [Priapulus caudatus]
MTSKMALNFKPVQFVRAKSVLETAATTTFCSTSSSQADAHEEKGKAIRRFYEDLVDGSTTPKNMLSGISSAELSRKESSSVRTSVAGSLGVDARKPKRNRRSSNRDAKRERAVAPTSESNRRRRVCEFLRSAQDGDLRSLERMLRTSRDGVVDVNAADEFGWTALMCAAHAGRTDVVALLARNGADAARTDARGMTAADIAREARRYAVVDALCPADASDARLAPSVSGGSGEGASRAFCDVCGVHVDRSDERHSSSTVHLFNLQLKPKSTLYHIPESNLGFQLMLRTGWDKDAGLGPVGSGQKFPVKTVLKRDRQGLGSKKKTKAKVTHFGPNDVAAVQRVRCASHVRIAKVATLSKKARKKQEVRQKSWEENFRRYYDS